MSKRRYAPRMQQAKGEPLVELKSAKLIITIEAEYDLTEDGIGDVESSIERALDQLRELGAANVTARRVLGVVKGDTPQN